MRIGCHKRYACDCTVKTADKPAQPIEKSTAGAVRADPDTGYDILWQTDECPGTITEISQLLILEQMGNLCSTFHVMLPDVAVRAHPA